MRIEPSVRKTNVCTKTLKLYLYKEEFFFNQATNRQQYAGCTTTPTPKSKVAKVRIKMYEGVRKEEFLRKATIIKQLKTAARNELRELKPIRKYRKLVKCTSVLSRRSVK